MSDKRFGIAIDPWKLSIFKEELTLAGFTFEVTPGDPITVISVEIDIDFPGLAHKLQKTVEKANTRCAELNKDRN